MTEEWRIIAEFPDYAVSNLGNVRRETPGYHKAAGDLVPQRITHGYAYVSLYSEGTVYSRRVNRLVCIAFHGDPPHPDYHAAHNDGIRANNVASNLRWADRSSNMMDKHIHGTMPTGDRNGARLHPERLARGARNGKHTKPECTPRGERHHCSRLTEAEVRAIRDDPRSRRQIAKAYGVSKCAIDGVKTGKTWSHVA